MDYFTSKCVYSLFKLRAVLSFTLKGKSLCKVEHVLFFEEYFGNFTQGIVSLLLKSLIFMFIIFRLSALQLKFFCSTFFIESVGP